MLMNTFHCCCCTPPSASYPLVKFAVKEARQQGIHVSPTCLINGLVVDTSSSWSVEKWEEFLAPLIHKA